MSSWHVSFIDDDEGFGTRDAAIADAIAKSDPGDTVTAHQPTCRNESTDDGCPCGPQVIVVPDPARA